MPTLGSGSVLNPTTQPIVGDHAQTAKTIFDPSDGERLLASLKVARDGCITASAKAPIGGDVYKAAHKVTEAIDEVALVSTGRRDHFWLKPH